MMQAVRGEYKGTGGAARERRRSVFGLSPGIIVFSSSCFPDADVRATQGTSYHRRRRTFGAARGLAGSGGGFYGGGEGGGSPAGAEEDFRAGRQLWRGRRERGW
jgi:hypothetical protein